MTLIAEGMVLVAFFVFYRVLLDLHGPENLGVYALMRRILAMLLPLLFLGLSDGLGRYIAIHSEPRTRAALIGAGALAAALANGLALALLNLSPERSAEWLFGNRAYAGMILPFSLMTAGLSMHMFSYACLRGQLRVLSFNCMQLLNLALVPIAALLWFGPGNFARAISGIAACQFAVATLFLVPTVWNFRRCGAPRATAGQLRELFLFSLGRVPGVMVGAGLASLGPIIATNYLTMTEIGYLSVSLSLLVGVGGMISPLGSVLLPRLSALTGRSQFDAIAQRLPLLIGAVLQIFLFFSVQFFLFSDYVIELWMGPSFLPAARISVIVMTSLVFYGFYCATRSVLDAVSTRPINSINTLVALGVLLAITLSAGQWRDGLNLMAWFAAAFSVATGVLGCLTYLSLRALFPQRRGEDLRQLGRGFVANAVIGAPALLLKPAVTSHAALFGLYCLCAFGLYLLILAGLKCDWLSVLWRAVATDRKGPAIIQ